MQHPRRPVQSVEVSYLVHATEDPVKIWSAVARLVGESPPQVGDMEGHHGNRIRRVTVHLTGDSAQKAFQRISTNMSREQKADILRDLDKYLDEHSALYLRFDKQRLVSNSLQLASTDPVRMKVKPRSFLMGGDVGRFYANLLRG